MTEVHRLCRDGPPLQPDVLGHHHPAHPATAVGVYDRRLSGPVLKLSPSPRRAAARFDTRRNFLPNEPGFSAAPISHEPELATSPFRLPADATPAGIVVS